MDSYSAVTHAQSDRSEFSLEKSKQIIDDTSPARLHCFPDEELELVINLDARFRVEAAAQPDGEGL